MTNRRAIKNLLDTRWTADIPGRERSVPKPALIVSGGEKTHSLSNSNVIYIKDGGNTDRDPNTIGWDHEVVVDRINLDIRTSDANGGREAMSGVLVDGINSESYGGLTGEVKRIIDEVRRGVGPWDTLNLTPFDDISDDQGFGRFRVEGTLELTAGPNVIDPPESDQT